MKYYLMNKNEKLVSFETNIQYGVTVFENELKLSGKLPIGYLEIGTWIENRNYAKHKEHMQKWLKDWGIDTTDGFINITHALGVNDSFWIKAQDSDLQWENVNLYTNEFTDIACTTAFETGLYGLQLSTTTPEFTTDGTFPKCWIKDEKGIHILKQGLTGASNVGLEPYCEFISSNIGNLIFENVVRYDLIQYKGKLCSKCDLFTSEAIGYIPFGKTIDSNRYYSIPQLLQYFEDYDTVHNTSFSQNFRVMIVLDSIVFNNDRHLNNFGYLFDNDSLEIIKFAPLFDFNFSFLCSLTMEDLKNYRESLTKYNIGHKLGGDFETVGKEIITDEIKSMMPASIDIPKHLNYNMKPERIRVLEDIFHENYNNIRNGKIINIDKDMSLNKHKRKGR